ncbi:MAG: GNAT family N-acetyltransferase [Actinobacteria bacterium]|nr:GNAT family N-acetyltransferase [Actinomycetota bacterium]
MAYAAVPPAATPPAPALGEVVGLQNGATVTVRPIELTDAFKLRRMFERLSPETVYHRFFAPIPTPRDEMLVHISGVDHATREALVAVAADGEVVGIAQYEGRAGGDEAEVAITVEDAWQGSGLGTELLQHLGKLGARRGLVGFTAIVMGENSAAVRFLKRLSPETTVQLDRGEYVVYAPLRRPPARGRAPGRSATR